LTCNVLPVPSTEYPTPAKRPFNSTMDTHKIAQDFHVELIDWQTSLETCIKKLAAA